MSRALHADERGLHLWIERESRAMDDQQIFRELVQNGFEAGATEIIIDGWAEPDSGRVLARVSDNGTGMTEAQLVDHLSTLHVRTKSSGNYGVGARISGVARNPAGLTFASRTAREEGLVKIVKRNSLYVLEEWEVDVDGYPQLVEVIAADERELDRVGDTGTAVIMHGHGRGDTWNTSVSYKTAKFLGQRYYEFPSGVKVKIRHPKDDGIKTLRPFGAFLAKEASSHGELEFTNIAGLDGMIYWWVLPKVPGTWVSGPGSSHGGVGTIVDNEIFDYNTPRAADFGLIYNSVAKRVAILVWVSGAEMDTGRAGVVLPGRKPMPWRRLGAYFADHMPPAIDRLLSRVTVSSESFDAELAKLLDEEWMKKLDPVKVPTRSKTGDPLIGDEPGDAQPPGRDIVEPRPDRGKRPKRKRAAQRSQSGDDTGNLKPKVVTPQVEFLAQADVTGERLITYVISQNTLQIAYEFPPYVREIGRWIEQTGHPESIVRAAVESAYRAEFAATIIDANGQSKHGISPDVIEKLKSDEALYAKALGFQSLSERVGAFIKDAAKGA